MDAELRAWELRCALVFGLWGRGAAGFGVWGLVCKVLGCRVVVLSFGA